MNSPESATAIKFYADATHKQMEHIKIIHNPSTLSFEMLLNGNWMKMPKAFKIGGGSNGTVFAFPGNELASCIAIKRIRVMDDHNGSFEYNLSRVVQEAMFSKLFGDFGIGVPCNFMPLDNYSRQLVFVASDYENNIEHRQGYYYIISNRMSGSFDDNSLIANFNKLSPDNPDITNTQNKISRAVGKMLKFGLLCADFNLGNVLYITKDEAFRQNNVRSHYNYLVPFEYKFDSNAILLPFLTDFDTMYCCNLLDANYSENMYNSGLETNFTLPTEIQGSIPCARAPDARALSAYKTILLGMFGGYFNTLFQSENGKVRDLFIQIVKNQETGETIRSSLAPYYYPFSARLAWYFVDYTWADFANITEDQGVNALSSYSMPDTHDVMYAPMYNPNIPLAAPPLYRLE